MREGKKKARKEKKQSKKREKKRKKKKKKKLTTTLTLSPLPFALFTAIARTSSSSVPILNVSCSGLVSGIVSLTEALLASPASRSASTDSAASS